MKVSSTYIVRSHFSQAFQGQRVFVDRVERRSGQAFMMIWQTNTYIRHLFARCLPQARGEPGRLEEAILSTANTEMAEPATTSIGKALQTYWFAPCSSGSVLASGFVDRCLKLPGGRGGRNYPVLNMLDYLSAGFALRGSIAPASGRRATVTPQMGRPAPGPMAATLDSSGASDRHKPSACGGSDKLRWWRRRVLSDGKPLNASLRLPTVLRLPQRA